MIITKNRQVSKYCCSYLAQPKLIINIIITLIIISKYSVDCASLSVTSASNFVGQLTSYLFSISAHNNPSRILFTFGQWSPRKEIPFQTNYQCYLSGTTKLDCTLRSSQTIIECNLPSGSLSSSFTVRITNINNPSSTKPLPITVILAGASTQTLNANLSISGLQQIQFLQSSHNNTIGTVSNNVTWYFVFNKYFDANTFLKIKYDSSIFSFDFSAVSICDVISSDSNSVQLSNWRDSSSDLQTISGIKITNPEAALDSYTITAQLYYSQDSTRYDISNFRITSSLTPLTFRTIQGDSILKLGKQNQNIEITNLACPLNSIAAPSKSSYTIFQYDTNYITASACSIASQSANIKSCEFITTTFPKSITQISAIITNITQTQIEIVSYTYFQPLTSFYPLCSAYYPITLQPQDIINPTFDLSKCSSFETGGLNPNSILSMTVENWKTGDIIRVYGMQGQLQSPWILNTNGFYEYTLKDSDLINSQVQIPYKNPTFKTQTNTINRIEVYRPSINLVYAISQSTLQLCAVTENSQLSALSAVTSQAGTYSTGVQYTFSFDCTFDDYEANDYLELEFLNFDGLLFLTTKKPLLSGSLNDKLQIIQAMSETKLKVIINESRLIKSSGINQLKIQGMINPPIAKNDYKIQMYLYNGKYSTLKQQGETSFPLFTISKLPSIQQSSNISILQSNQQLTISLTNPTRFIYFSPISSLLQLQLPFVCNTNFQGILWPNSVETLHINLQGCTIPYLIASNTTLNVWQSITINGATYNSTTTNKHLQLQCIDYCLSCLADHNYCNSCAPSDSTQFFLLYQGQCYSSCPQKTFQPKDSAKCELCYETCRTCFGSEIDECSTCINYFSLSPIQQNDGTINICISTCGQNKYYDEDSSTCGECEIDCKYCIDKNFCFICKEGASLIDSGVCDFTSCEGNCGTCEGTAENCTTCIKDNYLYSYQCYERCPEGTYPDKQLGICLQFDGPDLYFPASFCSIVLVCVVCLCNKLIDKQMTESGRQNINIITYCSAMLVYMELFGVIIMLVLTPHEPSKIVVIIGLGMWGIANIGFLIYYNLRIKNDEQVLGIVSKMGARSKCIYYTVLIFSIGLNLRTYRILYCGIFRGVSPYHYAPAQKNASNRQNNYIANQNEQNQEDKQQDSQILSAQDSTKFQLKKPITLYLTILSLLGSILFLVSAVIQITENYFLNMLLWSLDVLFVVLASVILTFIDIWAGLKKSYLNAVQNKIGNHETMENLQEEEITQKKILSKAKTTKKFSKKRQPSPTKESKRKVPRKPSTLRKRVIKSPSPERPRELSPQEKANKQKVEQMKRIKSQYSGLYKNRKTRYNDKQSEQSNQIPDIKIFESIDFKEEDPGSIVKPEKIRKIQTDHRRMRSTHNISHRQELRRPPNQETQGRSTGMNWKMNDIFLGFLDGEQNGSKLEGSNSNDQKKTVKIFDTMTRQKLDNEYNAYMQEQNQPSYIEQLELRQKFQEQDEKKKEEQNKRQSDSQD